MSLAPLWLSAPCPTMRVPDGQMIGRRVRRSDGVHHLADQPVHGAAVAMGHERMPATLPERGNLM